MTGIPSVSSLYAAYQLATLAILAGIAIYDARHHLILNSTLLPFFIWCLLSIPVRHMCGSASYPALLLSCLDGFLAGGGLMLASAALGRGSIGGGDIKLAALLGILYGALNITLIVMAAALLAAAVMLIYRRKKPEICAIPFAPFLLAGCMLWSFR